MNIKKNTMRLIKKDDRYIDFSESSTKKFNDRSKLLMLIRIIAATAVIFVIPEIVESFSAGHSIRFVIYIVVLLLLACLVTATTIIITKPTYFRIWFENQRDVKTKPFKVTEKLVSKTRVFNKSIVNVSDETSYILETRVDGEKVEFTIPKNKDSKFYLDDISADDLMKSGRIHIYYYYIKGFTIEEFENINSDTKDNELLEGSKLYVYAISKNEVDIKDRKMDHINIRTVTS